MRIGVFSKHRLSFFRLHRGGGGLCVSFVGVPAALLYTLVEKVSTSLSRLSAHPSAESAV